MGNPRVPAQRAESIVLSALALTLPTASLIPLGGIYLFEKGWLLYWAIAALLVVLSAYLGQLAVLRHRMMRPKAQLSKQNKSDPRWSPAEMRAWEDVRAIARSVDPATVSDPEAAWTLSLKTIDAVARKLKPGDDQAVWHFTVPEALTIIERVSRRLNTFVAMHVPFGDVLTVRQMLSIYRARGLADVVGKAYDAWRLIRLVNPATAVTHEMRERLSKAILQWGTTQVSRRLAETYVEEIGRAAIDLYGGRLAPPGVARPLRGGHGAACAEAPAARAIRPSRLRQLANALRSLKRS